TSASRAARTCSRERFWPVGQAILVRRCTEWRARRDSNTRPLPSESNGSSVGKWQFDVVLLRPMSSVCRPFAGSSLSERANEALRAHESATLWALTVLCRDGYLLG